MAKNSNVIGIAAILLILAAGNDSGKPGMNYSGGFGSASHGSSSHGSSGHGSDASGHGFPGEGSGFGRKPGSAGRGGVLGGILPPIEIGGILNDLHRLTFIMNHMDNLGQMALNPSERPKLPPPSEIISKAIPDLGNIIETVAPLLSVLGGDSGGLGGFGNSGGFGGFGGSGGFSNSDNFGGFGNFGNSGDLSDPGSEKKNDIF